MPQARAWVDAADPGEEQGFDDLQRVMHRLWIARLGEEARQLAATGAAGAEDRERLRALHDADHAAESRPGGACGLNRHGANGCRADIIRGLLQRQE